jgi:hypothetical protein
MKLQELDARRISKQTEKVLENRLGYTVHFDRLNAGQTRQMLTQVRNLIKEHQSTSAFHKSERQPAYLKLIMLEQGLASRLSEQIPPAPGTAPTAGTTPGAAPGAATPGQPAVNPAQMGMQIAKQKKALQDQLKAAQEQVRNIQKQLSQPNLGMAETTRIAKRRLRESEIQQAQVVLAAQDMVDQIQKMLEQISEMQFKDLPALTDSIRNDMGVDQATKFQADATAALSTLLGAVQAGKTQLEGAQAVLTGQAPAVPGEEDLAADPAADLDAGADLDGDAADLEADAADLDVDAAEDDLPPASSLGRDRR